MATRRKGFDVDGDVPKSLQDQPFYGLRLDSEQMAFAEAILSSDIDIVFCNSKAGSGKTTIATGAANMLVQHGQYNEIIYIMSPYGERKQGWLPARLLKRVLCTSRLFIRRSSTVISIRQRQSIRKVW